MIKHSELTHLDLSGAFHKEGMANFGWLLCLPKLLSLTLHNVQGTVQSVPVLNDLRISLQTLRTLSSQSAN